MEVPVQALFTSTLLIDDLDPHLASVYDEKDASIHYIFILDEEVTVDRSVIRRDAFVAKYGSHILATIQTCSDKNPVPSTHIPFSITSPHNSSFKWAGQSKTTGTPIENVTDLWLKLKW